MYANNLAIVFGPNLLGTSIGNIGHHSNIVKYLILHYHMLFNIEEEEVDDIEY